MKHSLNQFVVASAPAALVGTWSQGMHLQRVALEAPAFWQIEFLEWLGVGIGEPSHWSAFAIGFAYFAPQLLTALVVSRAWAEVFSRLRGRSLDPAWILNAWLFTLLLPATLPLQFAALGLSFGVVFGSHVFGGTGRYIVNPALLGVVFLMLAYPNLIAETPWSPGGGTTTTWALVSANGVDASATLGVSWAALFWGSENGALGTSSALACLLGAGYLVVRGVAAVRVPVAAMLGLVFAALLIGQMPWYWHLVLGNFAFALAFIATDPTTKPATPGACVAFGSLFGVLTILLRTVNPDHPEGTIFALLLASLCVPLLDTIVISVRAWSQARSGAKV